MRHIIYIGLGGFGTSVVRELKRKIQAEFPQHTRGLGFIGIDTHPHNNTDILTINEYISCTDIDPNTATEFNPDQLGWYKRLVGRYKYSGTISGGANQKRPIGRLTFRFPPNIEKFAENIKSISSSLNVPMPGFEQQPPKAYIITSLAGGTGSGCFIDAIAVTKSMLKTFIGEGVIVEAIIVPADFVITVAPPIAHPELYANTYAALKELNYFLSKGSITDTFFSVNAPAGFENLTIDASLMPNPILFVSNSNEQGITMARTPEDLTKIIVEFLYSEQTFVFNQDVPNLFGIENITLTEREDPTGQLKKLSSFASVTVEVPYEEIMDYFALKIVDALLSNELTSNFNEMKMEALNWISRNQLREIGMDELQDSLLQDSEGSPLKINCTIKDRILSDKDFEAEPATLKELCKKHVSDIEEGLTGIEKRTIQSNAERKFKEVRLSLLNVITDTFGQSSASSVVALLDSILKEIKNHRYSLQNELDASKREYAQLDLAVQQDIESVMTASDTWIFFKKKANVEYALSGLESSVNLKFNKLLEIWAQEITEKLYDRILEECQNQKQKWDQLINDLKLKDDPVDTYLIRIQRYIDRLSDVSRRGAGNRLSILNAQQVDDLFQKMLSNRLDEIVKSCRGEWQTTLLMDQTSDIDVWLDKAKLEVIQKIKPYVDDLSFVYAINQYYSDPLKRSNLIAFIRGFATPLFPLNQNVRDTYENHWIIGRHESVDTQFIKEVFPDMGVNEIAIDDTYKLKIITIKHGLTFGSNKFINNYFTHYNNKMKQVLANDNVCTPHAYPDIYEDADELTIRMHSEEEGYELFVIARALNHSFSDEFIYNRGEYYYVIDRGGSEKRLGQGLANAVTNFSNDTRLKKALEKKIEGFIEEHGKTEIVNLLKNYYDNVLNPSYVEALRKRDEKRTDILKHLRNKLKNYISTLERPVV